jgi:hypothetical protein
VKNIYSTGIIYDHHLQSSKYFYSTGHCLLKFVHDLYLFSKIVYFLNQRGRNFVINWLKVFKLVLCLFEGCSNICYNSIPPIAFCSCDIYSTSICPGVITPKYIYIYNKSYDVCSIDNSIINISYTDTFPIEFARFRSSDINYISICLYVIILKNLYLLQKLLWHLFKWHFPSSVFVQKTFNTKHYNLKLL